MRRVLGAIRYSRNETVLHTDASLLPRSPAARASWNSIVPREKSERVLVTYDLSRLQSIRSAEPLLVTLNATDRIDPARILGRFDYDHPILDGGAIDVTADHGPYSDVDGTKDRASVSYTLNPDATRITSVRVSTFLRTIHDNMFKLGRLDHRFDGRDDRALGRLLTWDGARWAPLPTQ